MIPQKHYSYLVSHPSCDIETGGEYARQGVPLSVVQQALRTRQGVALPLPGNNCKPFCSLFMI